MIFQRYSISCRVKVLSNLHGKHRSSGYFTLFLTYSPPGTDIQVNMCKIPVDELKIKVKMYQ